MTRRIWPEQWMTWSCQFCKQEDQEVNRWKRMSALNLFCFICSVPEELGIGKMPISECKIFRLPNVRENLGLCGWPQLSVTGRSPVLHSVGLRAAMWADSRGTRMMGTFLPVGTFHTGPSALRAQQDSVSHTEHDSLGPLSHSFPPQLATPQYGGGSLLATSSFLPLGWGD